MRFYFACEALDLSGFGGRLVCFCRYYCSGLKMAGLVNYGHVPATDDIKNAIVADQVANLRVGRPGGHVQCDSSWIARAVKSIVWLESWILDRLFRTIVYCATATGGVQLKRLHLIDAF